MKIKDYRLLTLSALVRFPKMRGEFAYRLSEGMFDDPKEAFLASKLKANPTATELIEECDSIGGLAYIRHMSKYVDRMGKISYRDVSQWIEFLEQDEKKRTVEATIEIARLEIDKLTLGASLDPLVGQLVSNLVDSFNTRTSKGFRTLEEIADEVILDMIDLSQGVVRNKTQTGFAELDDFLQGGLPHGLVTLGALPGMGKTQLALMMGTNIAARLWKKSVRSRGRFNPGVVAFVSAEMTMNKLLERMAQAYTGISLRPHMPQRELDKVTRYINFARSLPLIVDDSDIITTDLIYSRLESAYMMYGAIRLIIIDFLELIIEDDQPDNKVQMVGTGYVRSKILAKRYNCPVIAISHLARAAEKTQTKVPSMSHLMYSRMAEGLSDVVLLIYNPQYYQTTGKPIQTPAIMPATPGTAYLIVDKNRWGPTGVKAMGWEGEITRWSDSPRKGMYHRVTAQEVLG